MSGLAKVFLVINLVLAVVFLGTSATLFSVRKDFKKESEELTKTYKVNFEKQKEQIEKAQAQAEAWATVISVQNAEIVSANALKTDLARKLTEAEAQLKTASTELAARQSKVDTLSTQVSQLSTQIQSLANRVEKSQGDLSKAIADRGKAYSDRNERILEIAKAEEKIASLEAEKKVLSDENEKMKTERVIFTQTGDPKAGGMWPMIPATVRSVKDGRLVILSVGSDDKVVEGMVFIVYRGDKYLGDVKVINVYKDMSGAEIIHTVSGAQIKEGDDAKTKQLL